MGFFQEAVYIPEISGPLSLPNPQYDKTQAA